MTARERRTPLIIGTGRCRRRPSWLTAVLVTFGVVAGVVGASTGAAAAEGHVFAADGHAVASADAGDLVVAARNVITGGDLGELTAALAAADDDAVLQAALDELGPGDFVALQMELAERGGAAGESDATAAFERLLVGIDGVDASPTFTPEAVAAALAERAADDPQAAAPVVVAVAVSERPGFGQRFVGAMVGQLLAAERAGAPALVVPPGTPAWWTALGLADEPVAGSDLVEVLLGNVSDPLAAQAVFADPVVARQLLLDRPSTDGFAGLFGAVAAAASGEDAAARNLFELFLAALDGRDDLDVAAVSPAAGRAAVTLLAAHADDIGAGLARPLDREFDGALAQLGGSRPIPMPGVPTAAVPVLLVDLDGVVLLARVAAADPSGRSLLEDVRTARLAALAAKVTDGAGALDRAGERAAIASFLDDVVGAHVRFERLLAAALSEQTGESSEDAPQRAVMLEATALEVLLALSRAQLLDDVPTTHEDLADLTPDAKARIWDAPTAAGLPNIYLLVSDATDDADAGIGSVPGDVDADDAADERTSEAALFG